MAITYITTQVSDHKGGRIWLEGTKIEQGGFAGGATYLAKVDSDNKRIILVRDNPGKRKVACRGGKAIIDLNNKTVADLFGLGVKVKAVVRQGRIVIRRLKASMARNERENRFIARLRSGQPLRSASFFSGGGVIARALHEGLAGQGLTSELSLIAEKESKYLDANLRANADILAQNAVCAQGPLEDLELDQAMQVEVIEAGVPCQGASLSGRSKNHLKHAEDHADVGAAFYATLEWIGHLQPAMVVLENVPSYANTASASVIRSVLAHKGYVMHECQPNGVEFGALENRDRWVMVAISEGLADMAGELGLQPLDNDLATAPGNVGAILEPVALDSDLWSDYSYLAAKETRDKAAGKGFARQLVDATFAYVGTIGHSYQKARSTEPFFQHPEDEGLSRLFTPLEHARIKRIPEYLLERWDLSKTVAHEVMGQSAIFTVFTATGDALGRFARALPGFGQAPANDAGFGNMMTVA